MSAPPRLIAKLERLRRWAVQFQDRSVTEPGDFGLYLARLHGAVIELVNLIVELQGKLADARAMRKEQNDDK